MKNQRSRLGLVVEGNTTNSSILRLDKLREELGPVKSVALSAARRLSNTLRAGHPVADYTGLQDAALILIRVPDASVPKLVQDLCSSGLHLKDLSLVLCETWLGLDALEPLKEHGAHVATVTNLALARRDWFVIDGDARAVRLIRRLIEHSGGRVTELAGKGKNLLFASELLASALPIPLFVAAQQALRSSGFSGNILTLALEQMLQKTVRDFMRGAKGRWGGPLLECSEETAQKHLDGVNAVRPDLAAFLHEQLASARRVTGALK